MPNANITTPLLFTMAPNASRQEVGIISKDSQQRHITHQNYHFDTTTMTASVPIATASPI